MSSRGKDGNGAGDDPASSDGASTRTMEDQIHRNERLRRSLAAIDQPALKRAMARMPQQALVGLAAAARVPAPVLKAGKPSSLRRVTDVHVLDQVAGLLTDECLEDIRERLGDEADDPPAEAVREAVDAVIDQPHTVPMVRLTLSMVAAGLAEAADICDRILEEDPRFAFADGDGTIR